MITLITLGSCWHKKIYRKETLDGGIEYETPEEAEKNEVHNYFNLNKRVIQWL